MPVPPKYAACPGCSESNAQPVSYTWWGGFIGPKIFNHVKCRACGTTFNGKTGNSNNMAITIYLLVFAALGGAVGFYLASK